MKFNTIDAWRKHYLKPKNNDDKLSPAELGKKLANKAFDKILNEKRGATHG